MKTFEKYLVIDEPKDGYGDTFIKTFDDLETANREADWEWDHLTQGEQKKRHIYVAGVNREDLADYAEDEDTGEIDWACFHSYDFPDGAFESDNATSNWFAVQKDADDTDWGTGSFDWDEAVEMAKRYGEDARIAEIDGGYNAEGEPTTDPICVREYHAGEDF